MAVLVTDGNQRSTLAVVRALGSAGIPVTVGEAQPSSLAGSSRYCYRSLNYPSPMEDRKGFLECVRGEVSKGQYRVLLPMTDVSTELIAADRQTLEPRVRLPIPSAQQIAWVQDKREMLLLARTLAIPCPQTFMSSDGERIEEIAEQVNYPVVIKPRLSHYFRNGVWASGDTQYAYDAEDLITKYYKAAAEIPRPLVQEKIRGEGRGVFLIVWNGELKGAFCHRRLREKPPWGGVSVYRESVPLDEALVEKSFALLKAVGWQGVAMVEFKVDQRDGQAKLMEVNGRFWGSLQLAIDAGINFPLMLYRLAIGESVAPEFKYRVGVKSRWLLGDLDHLLIRLRHARGQNGTLGGVSRLRACRDFLKFYEKDLHYEVFRLADPSPGWFECKEYVREMFRSCSKHLGESRAR